LALILHLSFLGLLVGIDHFMSVGNALAMVAISRWEGELSG
jgi:hypothetical protein